MLTRSFSETIPNNNYKLLTENSFQTILTNFYKRNHSKQYLHTVIRWLIPYNVYRQTIIRGIIPNKAYKLLSQNSFHKLLTNHYSKQYLNTITRKPISNSSYKLLLDNWKLSLQAFIREINSFEQDLLFLALFPKADLKITIRKIITNNVYLLIQFYYLLAKNHSNQC